MSLSCAIRLTSLSICKNVLTFAVIIRHYLKKSGNENLKFRSSGVQAPGGTSTITFGVPSSAAENDASVKR